MNRHILEMILLLNQTKAVIERDYGVMRYNTVVCGHHGPGNVNTSHCQSTGVGARIVREKTILFGHV